MKFCGAVLINIQEGNRMNTLRQAKVGDTGLSNFTERAPLSAG